VTLSEMSASWRDWLPVDGCHCEERSDEAISSGGAEAARDCFAPLAITRCRRRPPCPITRCRLAIPRRSVLR
jgi:hypothetical protein